MINLTFVRRGALALSVAAVLAAAPTAALASGGSGSGGSGGGGGTTTTSPTPTSTSCAKITSFSNSDRLNWGNGSLIQTAYSVDNSCSNWVEVDAAYVNKATGITEQVSGAIVSANSTGIGTLMYAGAPFSTSYTIKLTVTDFTFAQLDSRTASYTTRKANQQQPGL
ncbi:MAG TPA: hypothetical protein VJU60_07810 [Thermoleophilaceae bacterium]|nr:hypothetical protein [Thermoleophilaceae bacterium]